VKIRCADYLDEIYHQPQFAKLITRMTRKLKKYDADYDAIAFSGQSGSAVAYPLSLTLKKPLICVRKGKSHSSYRMEGAHDVERYIIVDDLIDSGTTMRRIMRQIKASDKPAKCVRIFLYRACSDVSTWNEIPVTKI
jgi:orotate phosphoribosyltransferase